MRLLPDADMANQQRYRHLDKIIKVPDEKPNKYLDMPPGLAGYWWETDNLICIPLVENKNPGDGTFSKWLKKLEDKGKMIFVPTIVSVRLDAMLRKHGYKDAYTVMQVDVADNYEIVYGLVKKSKE